MTTDSRLVVAGSGDPELNQDGEKKSHKTAMEGRQTGLFCRGTRRVLTGVPISSWSAAEKILKNTVCFPLVTLGVSLECEINRNLI